MQKQSRPLGISIIANFYIIAGIIGIVGISLSATSATKAPDVGALSLAESLYILVTGYGLRKAIALAWTRDFHWICNWNICHNFQPTSNDRFNKQSAWSSRSRCCDKHNHNKYSHDFCHRDNNLVLFLQTAC